MSAAEHAKELLQEAGIKPSYPRVRVLDYLLGTKSHPSAEDVFSYLVQDIPTLSRTTVHSTLHLLSDAGLARIVTIDGNQKRFDAGVADHGHFRCRRCHQVYDFPVGEDGATPSELFGFKVEERDVYFHGLCPKCLDAGAIEKDIPQRTERHKVEIKKGGRANGH